MTIWYLIFGAMPRWCAAGARMVTLQGKLVLEELMFWQNSGKMILWNRHHSVMRLLRYLASSWKCCSQQYIAGKKPVLTVQMSEHKPDHKFLDKWLRLIPVTKSCCVHSPHSLLNRWMIPQWTIVFGRAINPIPTIPTCHYEQLSWCTLFS